MAEELKDLDNLKPIDHAVIAKPQVRGTRERAFAL